MKTNRTIIVQAGGRGSRLRHVTWNKPKCLASVKGRPLLYHLFEKFEGCDFIIVSDYHKNVLENYLRVNPPGVECRVVKAGGKGTCSGINSALSFISEGEPFYIFWSDLIFDERDEILGTTKSTIFTTNEFTCRWQVVDGCLVEQSGSTFGVLGAFYFESKSQLKNLPNDGEFVKYLSEINADLAVKNITGVSEFGEYESIQNENFLSSHERFFNNVVIDDHVVTKTVKIEKYKSLNQDEINWYAELSKKNYRSIPALINKDPLIIERIHGMHPFQLNDLSDRECASILNNCLLTLKELHSIASCPPVSSDVNAMYLDKTISRVMEISPLIPIWSKESITVNGRKCKNWFGEKYLGGLSEIVNFNVDRFDFIHGDPTFSNIILNNNMKCYLIDPRGSFGRTRLYGDANYDFAKLYYSAIGNYDDFNRKKFSVYIDDYSCEVMLESSKFAMVGNSVFTDFFAGDVGNIKLIHALIWASLTGYTKDDVDSVIGAYCLATYYFEAAING